MKADLHLHSYASGSDTNGLLTMLGCKECYADPRELYSLAKKQGLNYFTLTDHNTIDGCLEIAHLPDVFLSEEVSTYFPEDKTEVHVLVYGINEALHQEVNKLRWNIYELTQFLFQKGVVYSLAHPLYSPNSKINKFHLERFFVLFDLWEGENGSRPRELNMLTQKLAKSKNFMEVQFLAERLGLPLLRRNQEIKFTAGSDDHSGFGVGKAFTIVPSASSLEDFLNELKQGRTCIRNNGQGAVHLAHTIYAVSYYYLKTKTEVDGKIDNVLGKLFLKKQRVPLLVRLKTAVSLNRHANLNNLMLKQLLKTGINARDLESFCYVKSLFRGLAQKYLASLEPINPSVILKIPSILGNLLNLYSLATPYFAALAVENRRKKQAASLLCSFLNTERTNGKKIGYFTDTYFEVNGVSRTNKDLKNFAQREDINLEIFISRRLSVVEEKLVNIPPIFEMPLIFYPEIKLGFPDPLELIDYCYQQNINHIHAATPGTLGICSLFTARLLGLPFTIAHHTDLVKYASIYGDEILQTTLKKYLGWLYKQADKLLVPSQFTKKEVMENFNIHPDKVDVFHRGVDLKRFNHRFRDEHYFLKYKTSPESPVLLYVGRVAREKGLDVFCEVAKLVKEKYPNVLFVVVGDGPYREELERKWGEIVVFAGLKTGRELSIAYASSDIFLFPSSTETFGMVVLEAQASGIPAIVSKEGAAKENIKEGETGFSCVPEPKAFYECLLSLLKDKTRLSNIKRACREAALSRPLEKGLREMVEKVIC